VTAPVPITRPRDVYRRWLHAAVACSDLGASQAVVLLTRYANPRMTLADAAKLAGVPAACVQGLRCPVMAHDAAQAAALPAVRAWLAPTAPWRAKAGGRPL
jgi:multisubunit Na+/H+ antiporter MnhG subunit